MRRFKKSPLPDSLELGTGLADRVGWLMFRRCHRQICHVYHGMSGAMGLVDFGGAVNKSTEVCLTGWIPQVLHTIAAGKG